jgi:A/G-specific adenine glycosylase
MDVGALVCRPDRPLCAKCPLKASCRFYAKGLWRRSAAKNGGKKKQPFKGSSREKRGSIVDHLREAAEEGITLSELAKAIHPGRPDRDHSWLVDLLEGLERDGLVEMTPGARRGSPRGVVRLPD